MTIDGSFRLGAFDAQHGLNYGVAELPAYQRQPRPTSRPTG